MRTLSKSDFQLARTCATKLYYRELGYPDHRDENPYLAMLAEGGYMVEQLAKLMYPDGIALEYGRDVEADHRATMELLQRDTVTLFEATLLSGRKLARVDILRKQGHRFELIEVKSKSFDGEDRDDDAPGALRRGKPIRGTYPILARWLPYLEDVTYQHHLLRELFPDAVIHPRLLIVDKSRTTSVEGLPGMFAIRRNVEVNGRARDLDVQFIGDPAAIDPGEFLLTLDVTSEVDELLPGVTQEAARMVELLDDGHGRPVKAPASINWECGSCEFRVAGDEPRSGFNECWAGLAGVSPHIFDLYKLGSNRWSGARLGDLMIGEGRVSMFDVDPARLVKKDGADPVSKRRQLIQLEHTRQGSPWFGDRLRSTLDTLPWPLHFIDFETSQLAVPYHRGMRPYGKVAFQWSCHTVGAGDTVPTHRGWLNAERYWPNAEFARTLRAAIGEEGRVLTWSPYERGVLQEVRAELVAYDVGDPELLAWLDRLLGDADVPSRLFDLHALCLAEFFHPAMKGSTSIKKVIDAIWADDPECRERYWLWSGEPVAGSAAAGPYASLPPVVVGGTTLDVADGTGAMRAYQAMMYGAERDDPAVRSELRASLERYCRLDTLAMVLICDYWRRHTTPGRDPG